jgi:hypothetical protein
VNELHHIHDGINEQEIALEKQIKQILQVLQQDGPDEDVLKVEKSA